MESPGQNPNLSEKLVSGYQKAKKAIELAKKARTIYLILTSSPLIVAVIVIAVIGFVASDIANHPSLDAVDLAFQCKVFNDPTNQTCISDLDVKVGSALAPNPGETGGITDPTPTYPKD